MDGHENPAQPFNIYQFASKYLNKLELATNRFIQFFQTEVQTMKDDGIIPEHE